MVKFSTLKGFAALATALAVSMGAYAATPISDAAGLAAIGNDLAGEYELTADINLTGEWVPIGNNDNPFTGTLDGKGHTISGLTYTVDKHWVGLFGAVAGTVKNLAIVDANIYGNEHVGIVAGRVTGGGVIENVFTAGYVNGRDHVGGIVGDAGDSDQTATVSNCLSAAYVLARDYQAGGIAGWTKGTVTIQNNVFIGEARCNGWAGVGGIVGFVEDGTTTVKNNVNAARKLTGAAFIDEPDRTPYDQRQTRGIVGSCYNENSKLVSADNLTSAATIIYTHDGTVVDQSAMEVDFNGIITPAADLKKESTYSTIGFGANWKFTQGNYPILSFMSLPIKGDYIHVADAPKEVFVNNMFNTSAISTYGRDVTITSSDNSVAAVENGVVTFLNTGTVTITFTTQGDAFCAGASSSLTFAPSDFSPVISSAADMEKLAKNPSANFVLGADIDMTGVEFTPISNFSGTLDGQGHWIRNLSFSNKDRDRTALFAEFSGEFIKNVGFDGINFVGNADVAAVVGETKSNCVISNVVVANSYLEGRDHVASIVGKLNNGATIINCISNAEIKTRSYQAAGIVGVGVEGTVEKCIFAGTVTTSGGATNLAGIVSLLDDNKVTIKNCLAAAASYTNASIGESCGLIVNQYGREVMLENNYVAQYSTINGLDVTGSTADSKEGAIATAEQVRSKEWYTNTLGLDFTNDWQFLPGGEGNMLPVLKWMKAPLVTVIFNMPSADGINFIYRDGNEFWECSVLIGSWGQGVSVTQLSGENYATFVPEDNRIYSGNENGELLNGGGTATFKVSFDSAINGLFTLIGRDTFEVNVSEGDVEKTIKTVEDFLNIRKNPSGKYTLGADIDLAGVEFNGFFNDGNNSFSGTLDGAGHSVKNFNLSFDSDANHGLFGKTSGATIKNIGFTQFTINGASGVHHVGLIGHAASTEMENVAIVGVVTGDDHVGLVAGDADGIEMVNCYAVGNVTGGSQVGGYFGCVLEGGCKVENCLSNVNAEATLRGWVGGFIGLIDKAGCEVTIKNSVSIGNCKSSGNGSPKVAAPFIAGNGAGDEALAVVIFTDNIYNSAATMDGERTDWPAKNETVDGGVVYPATAQNPNTLTNQGTYTAIGWDFDSVWSMGQGDYKYPVLSNVPVTDFSTSGIEDVITGADDNVVVYGANGEIFVSGLGESAAITVYTVAGVQVASAIVNASETTVAVPANGFYIVAVAADGAVKTAKVIVK